MVKIKIIFVLIMLVVLTACEDKDFEPIDTNKKPAIAVLNTRDLPEIKKFGLDNGLQVYVVENNEVPVITITAVINVGFVDEAPELRGISEFTAAMLLSGTKNDDAGMFADKLELNGTTINTDTDYESTTLQMVVLKENVDAAMSLFSDALQKPRFDDKEWEKLSNLIKNKILTDRRPAYLGDQLFREVLYGGNPYGYSTKPGISSLKRVDAAKIRQFYKKNYNASNCNLILAGDISPKQGKQLVSTYFSAFRKGQKSQHDYITPPGKKLQKLYFIEAPGASEADIHIGRIGIDYHDPNLYAALLMNEILSGYPSSRLKRLFDNNFKKPNKVFTRLELRNKPAPFYFYGRFPMDKADSVITMVTDEFRKMKNNPPTSAELAHAKNFLEGKFYMGTETSYQLTAIIRHIVEFDLPRDFLQNYGSNLESVTALDVKKAAQNILKEEQMTIVVSADPAIIKSLKKIAPVIIYDANLNRK